MTVRTHKPEDDVSMTGAARAIDGIDVARVLSASAYAPAGTGLPHAGAGPKAVGEVRFINGISQDGTINDNSFWGKEGGTAYKWGSPTAGTSGGTITYQFDKSSHWTAQEQSTFVKGMSLWESIADVHFKEVKKGPANVEFVRGHDGGAYTSLGSSQGHGDVLGTPPKTGGYISIDTSVKGFDMSGSFDTVGGYGLSTITHELGHLLGLGHAGAYNGNVNESTQQYSAYDDRMYSIMSYIFWGETDAKYAADNPIQGTNWGRTDDGYLRQAPHTFMGLDILAIQELYGAATTGPFTGGQTFGFHSNIDGAVHDYYDFTVNTHPVVTVYDSGIGNTLDLSGYTAASVIDLMPGTFSSMNGMTNNLYIDISTEIDAAVGGSGADKLIANTFADTLTGGGGNDLFSFGKHTAADVITDFAEGKDRIQIVATGVDGFKDLTIASDGHGGALVSWSATASVDLRHVDPNSLKAGDFVFADKAANSIDAPLTVLHPVHAVELHHLVAIV